MICCIITVRNLDNEVSSSDYAWRLTWEQARAFAQRQVQHYNGQGFLVDYLLTDNITTERATAHEMVA